MPGRYTLKTDSKAIAQHFSLAEAPKLAKRYNIGPTQSALAILCQGDSDRRTAATLHWGFVSPWMKDSTAGPVLINARSETVAHKPTFRDAFRHRRCLIATDGFYEWSVGGKPKQPYYITKHHDAVFAMAGVWEPWASPNGEASDTLGSFAILTIPANSLIAPLHERMPVILDETFYDDWLNPLLTDVEPLQRLLRSYPSDQLITRQVSTHVNSVKFDDPACIEPATTTAGTNPSPAGSAPPGRDGQLDLDLLS